jgi:peptidoglycan-N-acetylglucosamine deacetylase
MRRLLVVALVFAACAQAGLAAMQQPVLPMAAQPSAREQSRAVAAAFARGEPVSCGGGIGNEVALTFDDGPGPYTERLLQVLRRYAAHATFFVVGNRLQYWPAAVRHEARLGTVGDHTWSHPDLTKLPHWLVWLQLMRTQYVLGAELRTKPRLFRTPYALHTRATDGVARKLGLVEVYWDVDSRDDVPHAHVADVVRNVVRGLRPGAIVVMHDIHPWTVAALPRILQVMSDRGLRAVSVPELLALDPPAPGRHCPYGPVRAGA